MAGTNIFLLLWHSFLMKKKFEGINVIVLQPFPRWKVRGTAILAQFYRSITWVTSATQHTKRRSLCPRGRARVGCTSTSHWQKGHLCASVSNYAVLRDNIFCQTSWWDDASHRHRRTIGIRLSS